MRLRSSAIVGQLITRISSLLLSIGILVTLVHNLNLFDFSRLQICLSGIGICLWVLDFGSSSSLILNQGKNQPDKIRELLGLRILIVFGALILLTICALIFIDLTAGILIFAVWADLSLDTLNGFRQVAYRQSTYFLTIAGRKLLQIILLSLVAFYSKINLVNLSIIFIFSATLVLVMDLKLMKPTFKNLSLRRYYEGKWIWFQSGGTSLANLDFWILSQGISIFVIPTLAIGKKIANALGLVGGILSTQSMLIAAKEQAIDRKQLKKVFRWALAVAIMSLAIFIFERQVLSLLISDKSNESLIWIIRAFLIVVPVGVITSSLNSILVGMSLNKEAAISTYASTLLYLLLIFFAVFESLNIMLISLAIIINTLAELLMQAGFLLINERKINAARRIP